MDVGFSVRRNDQGGYKNTEQKYVSFTTIERIEADVCARSGRYTRPGAVLTGQDRVIFHPDRGNVHFRMRKGGRNNGVSGMHDRTDGQTALREIALHASDGHTELCLCLSLSVVGRLLCPLVCRSPAACQGPDVLLPAHLRSSTGHLSLRILPTRPCPFLLHPFAKHPTLHASARGRVATLVPGERVANRRPNGISRERIGAHDGGLTEWLCSV